MLSPFSPSNKITRSKIYLAAKSICEKFHEHHCEAYFVGGAVRDFVVFPNLVPKDIDISTSADTQTIQKLFPNCSVVGKSFGVCVVKHLGFSFEVATFRKDGEYVDRRHPASISAGTLLEDSQRRDFTMNALYYSPLTKEILDLHGGLKDIKAKTIRCVGNPDDRIYEDALRILRCLRFSANLKFNIAPSLKTAITKHRDGLKLIPMERILNEISKVRAMLNFARDFYFYLDISLFSSALRKKSQRYVKSSIHKLNTLNAFRVSKQSSFFEFFVCLLQLFFVANYELLKKNLKQLPCASYDYKLCLWFLNLLECDQQLMTDEKVFKHSEFEFFKCLVGLDRIDKSPNSSLFGILKKTIHRQEFKKILTNYAKKKHLFDQAAIIKKLQITKIPQSEYSSVIVKEYFNFLISGKQFGSTKQKR